MPPINKPPIGLTDQEILCVIAYLQTLGGTPTVTLQTKHHYNSGAAAPAGAQPPASPGKGSQLRPDVLQPAVAHLASAGASAKAEARQGEGGPRRAEAPQGDG